MMITRSNNMESGGTGFLLAVLTLPVVFDGEVELMEGLLEAGLQKLHIRKPGATAVEIENLLGRLSARWASRLVLHGSVELALRYGISQVHGAVDYRDGSGRSGGGPFVGVAPVGDEGEGSAASAMGGMAVSTSVHSWEEFALLPEGLAYAFISPLFDSISKPGYVASESLLLQPGGRLPCLPVGLGGIGPDTIKVLLEHGWKGAAVLGWIWEDPAKAVSRYEQLKKTITDGY
ncbi:MAG TPA: thiamine phosphate synthase [Puia sp.]|nr:thiamine phosphate synthase [Puia sp.]